jgi:hypothetical protein
MSIVATVKRIGKLAKVEVTAFQPFKPYELMRVSIIDQHLGNKIVRPAPIIPKKYDPPSDRYEYEDWIQEKAMEKWKELADREKERKEKRDADHEEVMRVTEEKWGAPPLVTLRRLKELAKEPPIEMEPNTHDTIDTIQTDIVV